MDSSLIAKELSRYSNILVTDRYKPWTSLEGRFWSAFSFWIVMFKSPDWKLNSSLIKLLFWLASPLTTFCFLLFITFYRFTQSRFFLIQTRPSSTRDIYWNYAWPLIWTTRWSEWFAVGLNWLWKSILVLILMLLLSIMWGIHLFVMNLIKINELQVCFKY